MKQASMDPHFGPGPWTTYTDRVHAPLKKHKLEIRFRKNLAKLTGSAVRINSKKPKGKKNYERKQNGGIHAGI